MTPSLPTSVSPELRSRISSHVSYGSCRFVFDVYLILRRELESIEARTAQWTSAEKKLPRRLLDARRIAKELEGVMGKLHQANEGLIVRGLHQGNDTAPLILSLDGDHGTNGGESRGHPRGCQSHDQRPGRCQGESSLMTYITLMANDDGRMKVRTTDFWLDG
jgi:hypothetical protein